jgi:hypothetical protein
MGSTPPIHWGDGAITVHWLLIEGITPHYFLADERVRRLVTIW